MEKSKAAQQAESLASKARELVNDIERKEAQQQPIEQQHQHIANQMRDTIEKLMELAPSLKGFQQHTFKRLVADIDYYQEQLLMLHTHQVIISLQPQTISQWAEQTYAAPDSLQQASKLPGAFVPHKILLVPTQEQADEVTKMIQPSCFDSLELPCITSDPTRFD